MSTFKVKDSFRTELSKLPGGETVTLHMHTGDSRVYDKVKNMRAYLYRAFKNPEVSHAQIGDTIIGPEDL